MNVFIRSAVGAALVATAAATAIAADEVIVQGEREVPTLHERVVTACVEAFINEIAPASDPGDIPLKMTPTSATKAHQSTVNSWRDWLSLGLYPYEVILEANATDGGLLARSACIASRSARVHALKTEVVDPVRLAQATPPALRLLVARTR